METGPAKRRGCLGLPFALWLPGLYLAFAIYAWIDFTHINHDGLANIGLFLVVFPVSMLDLILGSLTGRREILMPDGHGYLGDHALFYFPSVAVCTLLLWWIGRAIDRRL